MIPEEKDRAPMDDKTPRGPEEPGKDPASGARKPPRQGNAKSKKILALLLVIGACVGAFFGVGWLRYYLTHASTEDARVKGDLISISPTVQGKIRVLPIREGDRVKKGQLIAQLREDDYRAKVEEELGVVRSIREELKEAKADLVLCRERTTKEVIKDRASLNATRASINEAEANLRQATLDLERMKELHARDTISKSKLDKAQTTYDLALARIESAREKVKEAEAKLQVTKANTREAELKAHRVESLVGKLDEARGALALARLKLSHTTVTSPADGVVAKKVANIGEVIKPGQPIAVIVDLDNIWVEANLEETKVEHVRLGQHADLKVDAYPGKNFRGRVANIGAAAASEFALIPDNRSSGNFTKVTQRIPIKIEVIDPSHQLRPGMMVVVGIDVKKVKYGSKDGAFGGVKK